MDEIKATTEIEHSTSSVELKQTTKGVTFTVKCYDTDISKAQDKCEKVFNQLEEKYIKGEF